MISQNKQHAFSLVELLVVIAIMATIIGLALPNFLGARSRARDTKRKGELRQFQTALQLYHNDYKTFPDDSGGPLYNLIYGCGSNGTSVCPCSASIDFAAGGAACDTVYMTQFSAEFGTSMYYYQQNGGTDYCIKVPLENASDSDISLSQSRCSGVCSGLYSGTDYIVCSE